MAKGNPRFEHLDDVITDKDGTNERRRGDYANDEDWQDDRRVKPDSATDKRQQKEIQDRQAARDRFQSAVTPVVPQSPITPPFPPSSSAPAPTSSVPAGGSSAPAAASSSPTSSSSSSGSSSSKS